ncbi:flagellar biosynthetic protein FliP [Mobiluncus holmesii ATCC 35242]|uniref:Flagellar biosynthetic protein FliP n=1 Tax=Mobiluncus holmesii ATCC 35242 TaxID=887899 RepID=E6M534_9ACTO|nr:MULTISPECIES: flagellar type III secretion system pore protein FliP [Mobiluncus]EFU81582.1 flagellar biosynthetic protein FliP [Mobiluncus holmesii ATCC 35242]STY89774.1 Flagellar biosynthetic protein fliP precursor [Mobiluncus holmesii]
MSELLLAQHAASVADFQAYAQARQARQARRQAAFRQAVREQYRTSAARWERLGVTLTLPPDFTVDTLAPVHGTVDTAHLAQEDRERARRSRYGFGLKRRELNPAQRVSRLRLQLVWFLAVIAVFAINFSMPHASADPAAGITPIASAASQATTPGSTAMGQPGQPALVGTAGTIQPGQTNPNPNPGDIIGPADPNAPVNPEKPGIQLNVNGWDKAPSTAVLVFLLITVLSIAPSLLLMMTSFTKIFIVLAMARNAMGLNQIPPNQVISGLAIFLSLFIMSPTITSIWQDAVQPYMDGKIQVQDMFKLAEKPVREFMGPLTREEDIALMTRAADRPNPPSLEETPFTTLVPAFMISEVRSAFIIGFVVFIPFLVIDLVVGAALMSMGMMMLPPVMVSMPFKVLLFVMVDGWGLLTKTLIGTYR